MTTPTSNILIFPKPAIPNPLERSANKTSAPITNSAAASERFSGALARTVPAALDSDEEMHVAAVVRASIRFARRKGLTLDSLPPILRMWLLRLCDHGDPTCLMVNEWLCGNRRFMAATDSGEKELRK